MESGSDVKVMNNTADTLAGNPPLPSNTAWQEIKEIVSAIRRNDDTSHAFLLRVVQPGLAGLMDGSVSTLAPIFATAFFTHRSFAAFLVGIASAMGAGISMAFSEALSDDGEITGRGNPMVRGAITGIMTLIGGTLHTLPFLLSNIRIALIMAYVVVAVELVVIAAIRHRYFGTQWLKSILQVVGSGILVFLAAYIFGNA
ncbi:MAG TPA: VIT1/CCC1 transporter family protein [Ktedonobacteraceae bacterium]|jgi:hypothetical protein